MLRRSKSVELNHKVRHGTREDFVGAVEGLRLEEVDGDTGAHMIGSSSTHWRPQELP